MRPIILALSMLAILVTANSARADRRIALVVGNGAYKNIDRLPNAPLSAKAMDGVLRKLGFEIVEANDLTRDQLNQKLLEFGSKAKGADLALFYYAGQAVSIGGVQYLLPVDADIKPGLNVTDGGAIAVGAMVEQALGDARIKLVLLDASRDNAFPAATAAAKPAEPGANTLTAFATGPGQTAPDGPAGTIRPFTRALMANLAEPGAEIMKTMSGVRAQLNQETKGKEISWGHSNIAGEVYLNPAVGK